MLHGICNCSSLCSAIANEFSKKNIEVFAFDQFSHGKTTGLNIFLINFLRIKTFVHSRF